MDNNIIIDKINKINLYQITNQVNSTYKKLLMIEYNEEEETDPETTKLQYLNNILQEQFQQQFNEIYQISCRNRNNLLTLIEWISHDNPIVAVNLMLQRNDVIAKHINESLQIAPCKSNKTELKSIKFTSGIIDHFEIKRINAELEILSQQRIYSNYQAKRAEWNIWKEINQESIELSEQIEDGVNKMTELIQEELNNFVIYWRLIISGVCVFIICLVIIIIKVKLELFGSIFHLPLLNVQIERQTRLKLN
ncbi:hypothetical protein LOAG_18937 [Loa loa]|uniref:Uncharacterized protein n=1 Tax=Loa loa TaxID=7209 RepID=A0A1S0UDI7_LOALO|nr:hypothetical protein LOAG_18937 [Loa loa]EJD73649.1 hypothetical protein LOAG_18937 [Loa loa]